MHLKTFLLILLFTTPLIAQDAPQLTKDQMLTGLTSRQVPMTVGDVNNIALEWSKLYDRVKQLTDALDKVIAEKVALQKELKELKEKYEKPVGPAAPVPIGR